MPHENHLRRSVGTEDRTMGRGQASELELMPRRSAGRVAAAHEAALRQLLAAYAPIDAATPKEDLTDVVAAHAPFLEWYRERPSATWPPTLIRDEAAATQLAADLRDLAPRVVALDLETASRGYSNNKERAHGSIRLAQLAVEEPERGIAPQQWLADVHSVDVAPFLELLTDPNIETQVFNLRFEVEWLAARTGIEIANVYDPCLAWRYIQKRLKELDESQRAELGFPNLKQRERSNWGTPFFENTLSVLAPMLLGFPLAKDDQESDWGEGDLLEGQLLYATIDVAALPELTRRTKLVAHALDLTETIAEKTEQARKKILLELREPHVFAEDDADRLAIQLALVQDAEELEAAWVGRRQLAITHRSVIRLEGLYRELQADFTSAGVPAAAIAA
jgi:ribonuclease D